LGESIDSLRGQLTIRPDVGSDTQVKQNGDLVSGERVPLNRAIAVHLIGGVVNSDFANNYHLGFGALDKLPEGQLSQGYVYVSKFLAEVCPLYMAALFPEGSLYYTNLDDLVSCYMDSNIAPEEADGDDASKRLEEQNVEEGNL